MGKTRTASLSVTTSYQNVGTLLTAITGATDKRQFENGFFRVAAAATIAVRVSIVLDSATTGSDSLSNLLAPGEYLNFDDIDVNYVWVKTPSSTSTLEFSGSEAY